MSENGTVGEMVAAFLERCGVGVAFGVISIHNMPMLDALGRRGAIRFVPARGEAGAANMADACARVSGGLGVCITSTGTAAGNAAGALVEAQSAGTPLLHLTGQIETAHLDRNHAYIHEARDQLGMLRSVCKAAYRAWSAEDVPGILREAVHTAMSAPAGPVSIELPIDVQEAHIDWPADLQPLPVSPVAPDDVVLERLAQKLRTARRPLIWAGGGARDAGPAVARLAAAGFGVVTSTQGRGVLPEDHPRSLGAFTISAATVALYEKSDAMLIVGSRLRGNETLKYRLELPAHRYRIDADAAAADGCYTSELFVHGDAGLCLHALADRLAAGTSIDPAFAAELAATRAAAEAQLRATLGPYAQLVDCLQQQAGRDFVWVRDVTISNSTWGNRYLRIFGPRDGVHALGGGIGQSLSMAIGAAAGGPERKVLCLVGDGGFQLGLAELATAAQEQADVLIILMNSGGYGVIRNIQDAHYGGRHYFTDLLTPDFSQVCAAMGIAHRKLSKLEEADGALARYMAHRGPALLEVDMQAIGDFATPFAGPPVATPVTEPAL